MSKRALGRASEEQSSSFGPLVQRFDVGGHDQRSIAWVRALSAAASGSCALLLLLADVPIPVFMAAVLGVLMSLVWLGQARRAARLARSAAQHHLCVYRDGLVLTEDQKVTSVPFCDVREISVDEERLDIVVVRTGLPLLRLEPRYPGVEIHALVLTLQEALRHANGGGV